ncbi:MAG: 4-(cytidine 5'-diphospho)-2-C-methyl-D-erythritol kinase [Flavobacteriales bacterium]|jgi:4-diphosphocytidyl-2-C-methyl-D-erythritol kinase|nr:4-(cytidine 5'-diphospho)-2-C-methyl-D-erythritol kinase [Flavobacteriales bacterium]MBT3963732.1 4-(cytidine 5'-diphospho)-2-C-methyl-D-erythritol kinase [Flavobacteriales bacterium]MBT4703967.1 4-(cytidine 5'-diphospho)-2-C-methyl-D-erythritol kinase [Flavobacteriales bacterium]MBT4930337.1 4-(cytidine 5'-diphospho)-2-C-methyl-D-erythritol kinase [Flavobacteriales bacterium]MBT5132560.1 4-(cytidine 5'-diphospho)-2-C-methyl-D-erythritol kinase [Flavobacteriales bacterium]
MVVFPNIKINIGLFIAGKRPDGFHNIESVFYPVDWKESLEITDRNPHLNLEGVAHHMTEVGKVRFISYGDAIPGEPSDNLCIQVFQLLEEWFNLPSIDMHLLKQVPTGAGLGGGSADAAFMLRALKEYFELRISDVEAMELLAKVGSDCPFFWKNRPAFVYGRGEKMHPIELDLKGWKILLLNPGIHVSTKEAYSGVKPNDPPIDLQLLPSIDVEEWEQVVRNDFEESIFPGHPSIEELKKWMYSEGAAYASMTGSGSTVYGIFDTLPELPLVYQNLSGWSGDL